MGFTFRKTFRLPGGFNINLSKSGVGASWGVPGLRVGTGPKGSRVNLYVPGTGIGWTSSLGGGSPARAARKEQRELETKSRDAAAMAERERAAHEVAIFENRIAVLGSLHKESGGAWDWRTV